MFFGNFSARGFGRSESGNVAMMWALMGAVLIGLVGLAVDFTRAQTMRAQLQNAVDGAALAAARGDTMSEAERESAARAYFDSEMGEHASTATVTVADLGGNQVRVAASMPMRLGLARIVTNRDWVLDVNSDAERSGNNIEVALVLDVTGSMAGQRIIDLRSAATDLVDTVVRDQQTPYYSKVALIPYSMGVNAESYANDARGAITGPRGITGAAWSNTPARTITGITRASPAVVTAVGHGFSNGDTVYIAGVSGMHQVNSRSFTVAGATGNTFQLQGVNSGSYNSYSSGGGATRCINSGCSVVVTSNSHGFEVNDRVYITGVGGMTQLNNGLFTVSARTTDTMTLSGSGGGFSTYTSGGSAHCTREGCSYYAFNNASSPSALRAFPISTCVSERIGSQRYTDAAPSSAHVGLNYPSSANVCPSAGITPLTTDVTTLTSRISSFQAAGSTAGHIGLAWGWYALSPNWGYLFPSASRGASYSASETLKIVVLMTDGAFNTGYCNGVISANSNSGAGAASERINCNSTNGQPFAQADGLCDAMKSEGIIIYTVAFGLSGDDAAEDFMEECATSSSHAYSADNGQDLIAAFNAIAASITRLRITR